MCYAYIIASTAIILRKVPSNVVLVVLHWHRLSEERRGHTPAWTHVTCTLYNTHYQTRHPQPDAYTGHCSGVFFMDIKPNMECWMFKHENKVCCWSVTSHNDFGWNPVLHCNTMNWSKNVETCKLFYRFYIDLILLFCQTILSSKLLSKTFLCIYYTKSENKQTVQVSHLIVK